MNQARPGPAATWRDRAEAVDWAAVRAELDRYGCALTGPLLTPGEAAEIAAIVGGTADTVRRAAADGIATLRRVYPGAAGTRTKGEACVRR